MHPAAPSAATMVFNSCCVKCRRAWYHLRMDRKQSITLGAAVTALIAGIGLREDIVVWIAWIDSMNLPEWLFMALLFVALAVMAWSLWIDKDEVQEPSQEQWSEDGYLRLLELKQTGAQTARDKRYEFVCAIGPGLLFLGLFLMFIGLIVGAALTTSQTDQGTNVQVEQPE